MQKIITLLFILTSAFLFSQGKEAEVYTIVEEAPEFPGGTAEMSNFIRKNLVFPKSAINDSSFTECKTYIKFIVNENGDIGNAEIIKGCNGCNDCDKEALRIVMSMPKWKAGKLNGRAVKAYYNLPLKFKK